MDHDPGAGARRSAAQVDHDPATEWITPTPPLKELPSKPPRNLQPQLFFALTGLALKAGEVVSMADLADDIQRLGRFPRKPVAPDARDLRYRLRSLRAGLSSHANAETLDAMIENVSGFGLRLNCNAQVVRARDELLP